MGSAWVEGWHEEYGGPHAEVNAIRSAGDAARGATAYVSLEPCSHHGQTPPCSEVLLRAGVSRVVFGASDPGDETGGGGELLAQAGVEVVGPSADVRTFHDVDPAFFLYNAVPATVPRSEVGGEFGWADRCSGGRADTPHGRRSEQRSPSSQKRVRRSVGRRRDGPG